MGLGLGLTLIITNSTISETQHANVSRQQFQNNLVQIYHLVSDEEEDLTYESKKCSGLFLNKGVTLTTIECLKMLENFENEEYYGLDNRSIDLHFTINGNDYRLPDVSLNNGNDGDPIYHISDIPSSKETNFFSFIEDQSVIFTLTLEFQSMIMFEQIHDLDLNVKGISRYLTTIKDPEKQLETFINQLGPDRHFYAIEGITHQLKLIKPNYDIPSNSRIEQEIPSEYPLPLSINQELGYTFNLKSDFPWETKANKDKKYSFVNKLFDMNTDINYDVGSPVLSCDKNDTHCHLVGVYDGYSIKSGFLKAKIVTTLISPVFLNNIVNRQIF